MMKVDSKIIISSSALAELETKALNALGLTAESLTTEVKGAQVIPMDKGVLSGDNTFSDLSELHSGKASVVSSTPYARRLYYHPEYNFKKDKHANAKGEWFEDWINGGVYADYVPEEFKNFMDKLGGA